MCWPEWDCRHYLWLAVVLLHVVFIGVALIIRRNEYNIVISGCVLVANALSFGSSAWIVAFLPSRRPGFAQRLLPKQIFLLSHILSFLYAVLTIQDTVQFVGIPSSLEDASLVCTWTLPTVFVLRAMMDFLVLHLIIGFVCLGFGLERLLSPMDKSLCVIIPLGIISGIIQKWLVGDISAVHDGRPARTLRPIVCMSIRNDMYGTSFVLFCASVAVVAFLALMMRALRNREDNIALALCWRVALYLSVFVASNLSMVLIHLGKKDQDDYCVAIISNRLFGFLTILIYIVQSKLCLTKREPLACPGSTIECNDRTDSRRSDVFASVGAI
eukprot:TRINITY_DN5855_c0_g1_i9.p1 TRINITY_DN5855_c0_g1~~TRINITY_DN5855_c0_g1_i9.p1  ORF type:complete len:328 (-),score=28.22 TRINITY_DN5855_c0_g1_i9:54-1037(-)